MKLMLLALLLINTATYAMSHEYYQVDEYLKLTKQEHKYNEFKKIVKDEAKAIGFKNKKIKIVLVYPANQLSDYWRRSKVSFIKRLDELKIDYELIEFFSKPAVEIKEQSKHLMKALKLKPDYLIFTLDVKKHKKFIERILLRNNTKLILQNITTPIKEWKSRQVFLYVGFDHFEGSKLLANYYINKLENKGNYAVLYGSKGYISYMRGTKFINYVRQNSNLKLVDEYYTDVSKERAKEATFDLLKRNKDIKFIYATRTDMALGIMEALEEKGLLNKIMVNGWGGGSAELDAIVNNKLQVTAMRMNDDNGVAMAEAIKLDISNQSSKVPTIYTGEFEIVDRNIDLEKLDSLKAKAFRYTINE